MKKLFILLSFIFLTGCTANYKLTYIDGIYKEEFIVESNKTESCGDNLCSFFIDSFYETNISINYLDSEEELALNEDLEEFVFYNKNIVDSNETYGIELGYEFKEKLEYTNSYIARNLFNKIVANDNEIYASDINNIFLNYIYLDEIVVSFSTDKIIGSTNCDEIKDDVYYWYINENNYQNKTINIMFNNSVIEDESLVKNGYLTWNFIKYVLYALSIIFLAWILLIVEKIKKSNK